MSRPEQTRRRIIDNAYTLFYRSGFGRVSVDNIAAAAGVTKRTLYYRFKSKDQLLESVLEVQGELALTRIRKREPRYSGSADEILSVLYSDLAKWSATPGWTGAGFTRLVMELADLPGHPARVVARRHKAALEAWWTGRLRKAGVASPSVLIHGDRHYADAAARAAIRLVSCNAPRRTSARHRFWSSASIRGQTCDARFTSTVQKHLDHCRVSACLSLRCSTVKIRLTN
jgi:AcrR family transcriptional regulator